MSRQRWQPDAAQRQLLEAVAAKRQQYDRARGLMSTATGQRAEAAAEARAAGCTWQAISEQMGVAPISVKEAVRRLPERTLRRLGLDRRGNMIKK